MLLLSAACGSEWVLDLLADRETQVELERCGAINSVPNASRLVVLQTESRAY